MILHQLKETILKNGHRRTENVNKSNQNVGNNSNSKSENPPSEPIVDIHRKTRLKLVGIMLQNNQSCWDLHVNNLLSRASSRMNIIKTCRSYGYFKEQLTLLFDTLIMSLFKYGIEVWGLALEKKYLDFLWRACRYRYTTKCLRRD